MLVGHATISKQDHSSNMTTVGLSFDEKTCSVTGVMVCGPAFNSKKVQKGDIIVAVDGINVSGNQIFDLLKKEVRDYCLDYVKTILVMKQKWSKISEKNI